MKTLITIFLLVLSANTLSYVENVTKGYANCMSCHISPNGGGILTDYGRVLSSAMMSTWKVRPGFENPYYGLFKNTQSLKLGGQLRTIQVHAENNQVKIAKKFVMQNNLEFAYKIKNVNIVGTIGRQEGPKTTKRKGEFLSERHYLLWETSEDTRVRIGKFKQHFGINTPDHTRFVKQSLGFGSNSETYNFEVSKYYDWGEINISQSVGDFFAHKADDLQKRNLVFNFTHYGNGSSRFGTSLLLGRDSLNKRRVYGVNAVSGLSKNTYFLSELNYERKIELNSSDISTDALFGVHTLGYKAFKGGTGYFVFEHSQNDLSKNESLILSPGVGVQLLPIPHVEVQLEYQRRSYQVAKNNPEHRSFMIFHLYH
ncbi:hypothetical protein A9Q84_02965 [Halobacteriovorax marinus]|uniref:Cytochrome c domain-containing protein n=1 Tax=Halobacteriovorax marinus TaxID=97084 RepID=A0A1Y5FD96_9BACT|nr:hypothetical protein A9Q84_02965 [Halobacteriovorax marinus]